MNIYYQLEYGKRVKDVVLGAYNGIKMTILRVRYTIFRVTQNLSELNPMITSYCTIYFFSGNKLKNSGNK